MKGIRFKLWIYTSLLLVTLLGLTYLMQSSILDSFYINRESGNLKDQAQKLSDILSESGGVKDITSEMDYIVSLTGGRAALYDESGILKTYSGRFMQGRLINIELEMLNSVLSGRDEYKSDNMNGMQMKIVSVGVPVKVNGNIIGAVFLHSPTSPMQDAVVKLKRQFLVLFIIALIISTLGAIIISKRFTNPIINIKIAAGKIAKGNYRARAEIKGEDEFKELADTINEMAQDLEKTEKLRRDFIANVSHEFRTPLGIIKGFAEALSDDVVPDNEKKEYADSIIDEANRLNGMVNGILDLSKIESGNLKLNKTSFDFSELIKDILDKINIIAGKRHINFNGGEAEYFGDRDTIGRAVLNIVSNAIEHTDEEGKIELTLKSEGLLTLSVSDNGKGIDEEHLKYIFDRFYRAKNSRGGSGGLGLAIAREIIRAHGGDIKVKSEKGKGSEFVIELPYIKI